MTSRIDVGSVVPFQESISGAASQHNDDRDVPGNTSNKGFPTEPATDFRRGQLTFMTIPELSLASGYRHTPSPSSLKYAQDKKHKLALNLVKGGRTQNAKLSTVRTRN
jgi:hypothetical protein